MVDIYHRNTPLPKVRKGVDGYKYRPPKGNGSTRSSLWLPGSYERNARVFRGVERQPSALLPSIKLEGDDWISVGATHLDCLFCE
jgi:hypothetical protein